MPVRHVLTLIVAVVLTASTGLVASTVEPATAAATTAREARLLHRINHARARHGLGRVTVRADLMTAARSQARTMAATGALSHTASFSGLCCWSAVAENVGYGATVRVLHRQFLASAPHRANILDPRMRQVGVGTVRRDGRLWVTEIFRAPAR